MKTFTLLITPFLMIGMLACVEPQTEKMAEVDGSGLSVVNPPAEGFNEAASDPEAIAIADEVMQSMGGRAAWDSTRYLAWNFFGRRHLIWDKQTGNVRIDIPSDSSIFIINVHEDTGRAMVGGKEITRTDSLDKYIEQAKKIWVNDSYWLVMPYKLKDSGVSLAYLGEDTIQGGEPADVLELRFENVGFTPDNKYRVFVDKDDRLVRQWAYYRDAAQDTPNIVTPWDDYREYGSIRLSGDRGQMQLSEIQVMEEVPEETFALQPYSFDE
jgi:hypothetical protein